MAADLETMFVQLLMAHGPPPSRMSDLIPYERLVWRDIRALDADADVEMTYWHFSMWIIKEGKG